MMKCLFHFGRLANKRYDQIMAIEKQIIDLTTNYVKKLKSAKSQDEANTMERKFKQDVNALEEQKQVMQKELKNDLKKDDKSEWKEEHNIDLDEMNKNNQSQKIKEKKRKSPKAPETQTIAQIPAKMEIRNLRSPLNEKGQLILLGVQKNNQAHALYVYDALMSLRPQMILTQMTPDHPFFIKSEDNYENTWRSFITGHQATFHVSPNPIRLQDVILNESKINWMMKNNIGLHPDYAVTPVYIEETLRVEGGTVKVADVLKTPLLFSSQNYTPVAISGYPELVYRDTLARTVDLQTIWNLFKQKQDAIKKNQSNFDPLLLKPDVFIKPKMEYEVELMKQALFTFNRSIAIVDVNSINQIEEQWQKASHQDLCTDLRKLHNKQSNTLPFNEYMRKLALLDLLLGPYLTDYFIKHECFPYDRNEVIKVSLVPVWETYQYRFKNDEVLKRM